MKDHRPSITSLVVAHIVLILGGDTYGQRFLPPRCLEVQRQFLAAANLPLGRYPFLLSNPVFSRIVRWFTDLFLAKHLLVGFGFRKCWIEQQLRTQINTNGIRQVFVIATGYDTLAYRLAQEYTDTVFWEIDHPATLAVKQRGIEHMGVCPPNVQFVPIDLAKTKLSQQLLLELSTPYDRHQPTVVVMEGLLYYLSEEQIRNTLADLAVIMHAKSVILFDYFQSSSHRVILQLLSFGAGLLGERMHWTIDHGELPSFFEPTRWKLTSNQDVSLGMEHLASVSLEQ